MVFLNYVIIKIQNDVNDNKGINDLYFCDGICPDPDYNNIKVLSAFPS